MGFKLPPIIATPLKIFRRSSKWWPVNRKLLTGPPHIWLWWSPRHLWPLPRWFFPPIWPSLHTGSPRIYTTHLSRVSRIPWVTWLILGPPIDVRILWWLRWESPVVFIRRFPCSEICSLPTKGIHYRPSFKVHWRRPPGRKITSLSAMLLRPISFSLFQQSSELRGWRHGSLSGTRSPIVLWRWMHASLIGMNRRTLSITKWWSVSKTWPITGWSLDRREVFHAARPLF